MVAVMTLSIQEGSQDADSMDKVSNTSQPEIDEEGYTIRKMTTPKDDESSDSSSDSDSDGDDRRRNKLTVKQPDIRLYLSLGLGSITVRCFCPSALSLRCMRY